METVTFDRASAVKIINRALQCITKNEFQEARRLFQGALKISKFVERDGRSLWAEEDREALKNIGEELFRQATECVNCQAYQRAIKLGDLIQNINEIIGGFIWSNVFYMQGVAYKHLGDMEGARKSFAQGAFLDPRCKRELEEIRNQMPPRRT